MTTPDWIDQADVAWVRALARSLCRDDGAADDAAQETLLVWMQRLPGRSAPRGWLRRVLENRLRQGVRTERRRREREHLAASGAALSPRLAQDDPVERARLQREVMDAVLGLAEPYREAVLLRYFEGQSPAKIAARQGVPRDTVKTRLKRGRAKLRERLDAARGGDRGAWVMAFQTHLGPAALGKGGLAAAGAFTMTTKLVALPVAVLAAAVLYFAFPSTSSPERVDASGPSRAEETLDPVPVEDVETARAAPERESAEADAPAVEARTEEAERAAPEVTVEVRVIDVLGEPVAGVPVRCTPQGASPAGSRAEPFGTTDRAGRIVAPMARAEAEFSVETERWTTVQRGTVQSIGTSAAPTVMVSRPRVIEGRVIDHLGAPVADARVAYRTRSNPWTRLEITLDHGSAPKFTVVTDGDGAFVFEGVPEMPDGRLDVTLGGADLATASIPDAGNVFKEIELVDPKEGERWLRGVVVDVSGAPIEDAQVSLGYRCAATGPDGSFALDTELPMRGNALLAAAQGHLPTTVERGPDGEWPEPLVVTLDGSPLGLAGRVVREDGTPVPGALMRLIGTTEFGLVEDPDGTDGYLFLSFESYLGGASTRDVPVDAEGRFAIEGLLAKDYHLVASVPGALEAQLIGPVQAGNRSVVAVLPDVRKTTEIVGRVVDTSGAPIPAARLTVSRTIAGPAGAGDAIVLGGETATADEEGRFAFGPVARAGGLRLRVYAGPKYALEVVEVDDAGGVVEVEVEVPGLAPFFVESGATGARSFQVQDDAGASVQLFQAEGHGMFSMEQGFFSEGRSPVFSCPEGSYEVVLSDANGAEVARRRIELSPGEPRRVAF